MDTKVELQPWFTPDETQKLIRVLEQTVLLMRNTAKFSSIRKDLKWEMESNADDIERITLNDRTRMYIDPSVFLALEEIGVRTAKTMDEMIVKALEDYISRHNKKGNNK